VLLLILLITAVLHGAGQSIQVANTQGPGESSLVHRITQRTAAPEANWKQESYYRYAPAVFALSCKRANGSTVSGTGFTIGDALLVTNYHVVQTCSSVVARAQDGREYKITKALAFDRNNDFAVLDLGADTTATMPLGDSNRVRVGDAVISIGDPLGLERTLAEGLITAFRSFGGRRLFQTNTDTSHGSSGSPLINDRGQVIGIIVATLSDGQKLNFAVPINYVRDALAKAPSERYSLLELARLEEREQGAVYFTVGACFEAVRIAMEADSDSSTAARIEALRLLLSSLQIGTKEFLQTLAEVQIAVRFGELTKEQRQGVVAVIAEALVRSAATAGASAKLNFLTGAWLERLALSPLDRLASPLTNAPLYLKFYIQLGAPQDVIEGFRFLAAVAQNGDNSTRKDFARVVLVAEMMIAEMGIAKAQQD
jgi:S1-C subfamily serine protease